jgi:hypothetical protein
MFGKYRDSRASLQGFSKSDGLFIVHEWLTVANCSAGYLPKGRLGAQFLHSCSWAKHVLISGWRAG